MKFNGHRLALNMEPLASPSCDTLWETHLSKPPASLHSVPLRKEASGVAPNDAGTCPYRKR